MGAQTTIDCYGDNASASITKRCCVLAPPEYVSKDQTFPVLYLLHGIGETETDWKANRQMVDLLDALIRAQYIPPMVVVMPHGFVNEQERIERRMPDREAFDDHLMETIAGVTRAYPRISSEARHHAIAGISMGGKQAIEVGLAHPEYFSVIGALSAAIQRSELERPFVRGDPAELRKHPRFFFSRCGARDAWKADGSRRTEKYDLAALNAAFAERLRAAGVDCDASLEEGYHDWDFWSPRLSLLFTSVGVALVPSMALRSVMHSICMALHLGVREGHSPPDDARVARVRLAKPASWSVEKYEQVLWECECRLPDCLGDPRVPPPEQWVPMRARWKGVGLAAGDEDIHRLYAGFFDACEQLLAVSIERHGNHDVELRILTPVAHWRAALAATQSTLTAVPWRSSAPSYARRRWVDDVPTVLLNGQTTQLLTSFRAARAALGPASAADPTVRDRASSAREQYAPDGATPSPSAPGS